MAIKIANDLNLFELIASKEHSLSELANITGADSKLLSRVLRVVTAIGWLKQTEQERWLATQVTHLAAATPFKNILHIHYDTRISVYAEFPAWLKKHHYKTSWASDEDNLFKEINGTGLWSMATKDPEYSERFDSAMSIHEGLPSEMMPTYPFVNDLNDIPLDETKITLVDVGGGAGQVLEAIKQKHPHLTGRFVLQDLPKTIDNLDADRLSALGIEAQPHDFFLEQPVVGARYYHLRRILHDWNDEKCRRILKALHPAFDPAYSKLIIIDHIVPDINPGIMEAQVDLMMMVALDGAERSISEWRALLGEAGFKIDQIVHPDVGTLAMIEASVI